MMTTRLAPSLALAAALAAPVAAQDSDLKDAPAAQNTSHMSAGTQTLPRLAPDALPRVAPAAAPQTGRRRAGRMPDQILMAELRAGSFRKETPLETRAAVEAFLDSQGWKLQAYQDNDALAAIEFKTPEEPRGVGASLRRLARIWRIPRRIKSLPLVASVRSTGNDAWTALLSRPAYPDALARLWSPRSDPRLVPQIRPAQGGIWVVLSVEGWRDPEAAARGLRMMNPSQVAWAEAGYAATDDGRAAPRAAAGG